MTRDEAETLLPFYVNGTLDDEERAAVETAMEAHPELRAEVSALRAIRDTMQDDGAGYSPGEMGLHRLMRAAEAETAPARRRPRTRFWQAAAAVLLAVALAQGTLLVMRGDDAGFRLAEGEQAAFTLALRPESTEAEFRALLLEAGVEIVGGPSALGLYRLAVPEGVAQSDAYETLAASPLVESLSRGSP